MNETPQKRLESFIDKEFKTKTDFAKKIGILPQSLSKYVGNGKSVLRSYDVIDKLKQYGLNLEWYFDGKGEMLIEGKSRNEKEASTVEEAYELVLKSLDKLSFEQLLKLKRKSNELTKELMEL